MAVGARYNQIGADFFRKTQEMTCISFGRVYTNVGSTFCSL